MTERVDVSHADAETSQCSRHKASSRDCFPKVFKG